jgi:hypothetical protein
VKKQYADADDLSDEEERESFNNIVGNLEKHIRRQQKREDSIKSMMRLSNANKYEFDNITIIGH